MAEAETSARATAWAAFSAALAPLSMGDWLAKARELLDECDQPKLALLERALAKEGVELSKARSRAWRREAADYERPLRAPLRPTPLTPPLVRRRRRCCAPCRCSCRRCSAVRVGGKQGRRLRRTWARFFAPRT